MASKKTETVADGDTPVVRKGTNRDKVMSILLKGEGKFFKLSTLAEKLYGDAERTGPLGMVLKGIGDVIAKKNLGVELRKEKDGREVSVGLFRA